MRITLDLPATVLEVVRATAEPRTLSSLGAGLWILGNVIDAVRAVDRLEAEADRLRHVHSSALEVLAALALDRAAEKDADDDAAFLAKATDSAAMRARYRPDRIAFTASLDLCRSLEHSSLGELSFRRACKTCIDTIALLTAKDTTP